MMANRYLEILKRYGSEVNFYDTARVVLERADCLDTEEQVIFETSTLVTAPVLISYVLWILQDAKERNIERLYFLSRDGFVLHEIAKRLAPKIGCTIPMSYLYCSRLSLQKSVFHFLPMDEVLDILCSKRSRLTLNLLLDRVGLAGRDKEIVLESFSVGHDEIVSGEDLVVIRKELGENRFFLECLRRIAKEQYECAVGYMKQEGLFEADRIAIVDVGWLGSMQRALRQLLAEAGGKQHITGYYFGMMANPLLRKDGEKDGDYLTFYFSPARRFSRMVKWNISLFECLCQANHGMTTGYCRMQDGFAPVLDSFTALWNVQKQLDTVVAFADCFCQTGCETGCKPVDRVVLETLVCKLVTKLMFQPLLAEADVYGSIRFCDDWTDGYMECLAPVVSEGKLREYFVWNRVFGRKELHDPTVFWMEGTITRSKPRLMGVYFLNSWVWNFLRFGFIAWTQRGKK